MKTAIVMFIIILILAIVGPLLTIWALNTILPGLAIPMTAWTYMAMAWLHTMIYYKHTSK
jgi:hypothetical protein